MANLTIVQNLVAPLGDAIVRNYVAGGTVKVGDQVYLDSNGKAQQGNGAAAGTAVAVGIVTAIGTEGATSGASGDAVSVCRYGPVSGFSGLTPGAAGYVSDTAGKIADAAGTKSFVLGAAESATVFFVNPIVTVLS